MKWNLVKKHHPTGLAEIESFDVTKILEILMTANNHEWMGKLNGKKLLVSDVNSRNTSFINPWKMDRPNGIMIYS